MHKILKSLTVAAFLATGTLATGTSAYAAVIPYGNVGVENPTTYSFSATVTGVVTAVIAISSGAGFSFNLGYSLNGGSVVMTALNNHDPVGTQVSFGVTAGDVLRFFIDSPDGLFSSDKSLNADGFNHVYSQAYDGTPHLGPLVPIGTYVAFEDLLDGGDKNYGDIHYVFTNVTSVSSAVPEPATWAMMLIGFAGIGYGARRRKLAAA